MLMVSNAVVLLFYSLFFQYETAFSWYKIYGYIFDQEMYTIMREYY